MRLHKLRLSNLNSLQGTWEIDFSAPEILSEGLFLISGRTGAGKSTILDAICLALYGQTPRLGKINESSNEIMSRGSGDCLAQLSFSVEHDGMIYFSRWSQSRARRNTKGKLQKVYREISREKDGQVLAQSITEADYLIQELTGLKFEQFQRSILLAQGDFAAFLESNQNERAAILEKITGTEIYRQISQRCFERCKEQQNTTELLQKEQAICLPLSEEQRQELERQRNIAREQQDKYNFNLQTLQSSRKQYETLGESWKRYTRLWQQNQEQFGLEQQEKQTQRKQSLQRARTARELQPLYQIQNKQIQDHQGKQQELQNKQKYNEELNRKYSHLEYKLHDAQKELDSWQNFQQIFEEQQENLQTLDWHKQDAEKQYISLYNKQQEFEQQLQEADKSFIDQLQNQQILEQEIEKLQQDLQGWPEKPLSALARQQNQIEELKQWLNQQDLPQQYQVLCQQIDKTLDEIKQDYNYTQEIIGLEIPLSKPELELPNIPEFIKSTQEQAQQFQAALPKIQECFHLTASTLEQYLQQREQYKETQKQTQRHHQVIKEQELLLAKATENVNDETNRLTTLENYFKTLEENWELHRRLMLLVEERQQLEEGTPCPLCGSCTHHPSQAPLPLENSLDLQNKLAEQKQVLREQKHTVDKNKEETAQAQLQLESYHRELDRYKTKLQKLSDQLQKQIKYLYQIISPLSQNLLPYLRLELSQYESYWKDLYIQDLYINDEMTIVSQQERTAKELRDELYNCQEQLNTYCESERQAHQNYLEAYEHIEQQQRKRNEQLQQLRDKEQKNQLRRERASTQIEQYQKNKNDFEQKLFKEFINRLKPVFLENPESAWYFGKQNSPLVRKLIETLNALLADNYQRDNINTLDISPSITSDTIINKIDTKELLYFLDRAQRDEWNHLLEKRHQVLVQWQESWQQQQDQYPLCQEHVKIAQQQKQQAMQKWKDSIQLCHESECEYKSIEQNLQQQMVQLLEYCPREDVLSTQTIQPEHSFEHLEEINLRALSQQIKTQVQAKQTNREQAQTEWNQVLQEQNWQQKEIQRLQAELNEIERSRAKSQKQWLQKLAELGFTDDEDFLAAQLSDEPEQQQLTEEWEAEYQKLQGLLQETRQQLANINPEIEATIKEQHQRLLAIYSPTHQEQLYNQILKEITQIDNKIQQVKMDMQSTSEELGACKKSLEEDDKLQKAQEQIAEQLIQQQQTLENWQQLNELIGSANGDKYNRFAQQLSFEQLLYYANQYLEKINDRYVLQSLNEQPLEFFVIDLYQQQALRPSSNLSGGEKFLISLALALALARISSNKILVQSLFLDEGFGTLDEEALHNTLEVLASLREDGKLIGLISHIPVLKERIMCQIQLRNLGEGRSMIYCPSISGIVKKLN